MELDRQTIEKRDFPIGRRGYEPEAVDSHLERVAEQVEALRRGAGQQQSTGQSLAAAASTQVQAIVEAAETTAADIQRQAEMEAQRVRQEAEVKAEQTREEAVARARSHVESVSEATSAMLQRVDAMETELGALIDSLRTGGQRLNGDLSTLQEGMGNLYEAAGQRAAAARTGAGSRGSREGSGGGAPLAEGQPVTPPVAAGEAGATLPADSADALAGEQAVTPTPQEAPAPSNEPAGAPARDDLDGARLIALNMALNGQPREEADRYLAENFELSDREGLLDEVYAAVES